MSITVLFFPVMEAAGPNVTNPKLMGQDVMNPNIVNLNLMNLTVTNPNT